MAPSFLPYGRPPPRLGLRLQLQPPRRALPSLGPVPPPPAPAQLSDGARRRSFAGTPTAGVARGGGRGTRVLQREPGSEGRGASPEPASGSSSRFHVGCQRCSPNSPFSSQTVSVSLPLTAVVALGFRFVEVVLERSSSFSVPNDSSWSTSRWPQFFCTGLLISLHVLIVLAVASS